MRLFRRRPRVQIDIDPVQLASLNFLLRFQSAPIEEVWREVNGARPVDREGFSAAIAGIAAQDLVDYRFQIGTGETLLALTALGARLKGRLPASSGSRLAIYL